MFLTPNEEKWQFKTKRLTTQSRGTPGKNITMEIIIYRGDSFFVIRDKKNR
jgi:hypothetical protein